MRFLKGFLPNLTVVLAVAMLVILYLDNRNPMMGFLIGWPFRVLVIMNFLCATATAVTLYISWRKEKT